MAKPFADEAELYTGSTVDNQNFTVKNRSDALADAKSVSGGLHGTDSPGITLEYGIGAKYAKSAFHSGELVPRSLFNVLMHFVTRVHFALQCGLLYQARRKQTSQNANDKMFPWLTPLKHDGENESGYSYLDNQGAKGDHEFFPDNAILPIVTEDGRVAYHKHVKSQNIWHPFSYLKVLPDNEYATFEEFTNEKISYKASDNCWMYIRSICIPSFTIKVNGQDITIHTQNQSTSLRYHGAVSHFDCLLLRRGDEVEFPAPSNTMRITYVVTPCVFD